MSNPKHQRIIQALVKNHRFGEIKARELIIKYIDYVEVNEDKTPEYIASIIEEQYMQED